MIQHRVLRRLLLGPQLLILETVDILEDRLHSIGLVVLKYYDGLLTLHKTVFWINKLGEVLRRWPG